MNKNTRAIFPSQKKKKKKSSMKNILAFLVSPQGL